MPLHKGAYRADHVGSFLRPREILQSRADGMTGPPLRDLEDKYIPKLVQKELDNGIRSITDGEFRREYFHLDFLKHIDGIEVQGSMNSTHISKNGVQPPRLVVTGKLAHSKPIQVDDFLFLQKQLQRRGHQGNATVKVCIPSPTMVHFRGGRESISQEAYPDLEAFFEDLATVYQQEIDALYQAGCRFLQLDDTNLAYLCDETMRKEAETRHGTTGQQIAQQYAGLINSAVSKRPSDMVLGIHLCRGNHRSQWFAQGGYEPVAETLFNDLDVDVYFLEYDDARSGDFSPLKYLPEHKVVVLGVMTSKKPEVDDEAQIIKRLNEAAQYCPRGLDQLCLSHQCGFSSTMEGNDLTEDEQWAKIRMEVKIAKKVWGDDLSQ